ncbi:MAG TPA: multiheme c-type cytochrome [Pirellulales bacterium]|nr:multiheme c-type cytochrome [Pirellulales bacterium]
MTYSDRWQHTRLTVCAILGIALTGCPGGGVPTGALPLAAVTKTSGDTQEQQADSPYPKKKEIDYEKENGKIFENWPDPKLAILVSGKLDGYIEPCGCTGLENQKGGLSRRHSLMTQLEKKGWKLVNLDIGGVVRRLGPQAAIKYQRAIDALKTMKYQAVGFGVRDLALPTEEILATIPAEGQTPFICANVSSIFDDDYNLREPYRIVAAKGMKIGVTGFLGKEEGQELRNPDFQFSDPAEALTPVIKKLTAEGCDTLILLANSSVDEAKEIAGEFPALNYVIAASDSDPPSDRAEKIDGSSTRLIELGHKGMYVGVLAIFDDQTQPVRYQRVPLDGRFPNSDKMTAMMVAYQEQLKAQGLSGLGLRPSHHPNRAKFVGSETCGECHTEAFEVWKKTPHSHATETLVKLPIPRQHDPECLSCHVTGWEPQEYYPFQGGFEGLAETPHMVANGCENCHGPGEHHVAAESGDVELDDEKIETLRVSMRLTKAEAKKFACAQCHDLDNSPDFNFEKYWPDVEHHGKN